METLKQTPANHAKLTRLHAAWSALLDEVLQRGFHGQASLAMTIQDGTIQRICRTVERVDK